MDEHISNHVAEIVNPRLAEALRELLDRGYLPREAMSGLLQHLSDYLDRARALR